MRRRTTNEDILTPREWEVLDLLREGLTNEQIAERLGVSFATAKYHVGEILSKLSVSSREEAARWQPGAARRRWPGGWALLPAFRKAPLLTAGKVAAVSVIVAGLAGLALLAIGVVSISHREAVSQLGKVAFIQGGDVWVRMLPDGPSQRITEEGNYFQPEWSPSGEWLIVYRERVDRDPAVFVMSSDGAIQRELETPASWSPKADHLAYQIDHLGAGGSIVVEDADGSNREVVAASSDDKRIGTLLLGWSPDGKWLAYQAGVPKLDADSTGRLAIFAVRADGSEERQLFAYDLPNVSMSFYGWSPDSRYVLLSILDSPASSSDGLTGRPMAPIALDGSSPAVEQPAPVIFDQVVTVPHSVVVGLDVGENDFEWPERIALYNPATGDLSYLTSDEYRSIQPDWSPDGSRLAYSGAPVDGGLLEHSIWVSRSDGSEPRQLTNNDTYRDEWPRWSADGTKILFARLSLEGDGNAASLWMIDLKSMELTQVIKLDAPSFSLFRTIDFLRSGPYHIQWGQVVAWWRGP
jgi:Tol biopolymer transport system component/DNA-binding CsgD family transcriptional regulator